MSTQTVSPDTATDVLAAARNRTYTAGSFTVADVQASVDRSESTVRAAVAQLLAEGAVVKGDTRGTYVVVTTAEKPEQHATVAASDGQGSQLFESMVANTTDYQPPAQDEVQDEPVASTEAVGYSVYVYGAGGQILRLKRSDAWVLTTDAELANLKAATELPVSGWADGKRRAITELRVYVAGSPLDSEPVYRVNPQQLKKARTAG